MPFGCMLIGGIAGILSTFGFAYLQPFLRKKINLHDTCGIHNLHGNKFLKRYKINLHIIFLCKLRKIHK